MSQVFNLSAGPAMPIEGVQRLVEYMKEFEKTRG
jgi:phosphoserine aminotransferase